MILPPQMFCEIMINCEWLLDPYQTRMGPMCTKRHKSHLTRDSLLKFIAQCDVMRSLGQQWFGKISNLFSMFLHICVLVKCKQIHCLLTTENLRTKFAE